MRLRLLAFLAAALVSPLVLAVGPIFSNVTIFQPPVNYTDPQVLYARTTILDDGTLLATWENYSPEPPLVYFPIYRSTDGGLTWKEISRVTDQVKNWGLRYQPDLFVLPQRIGRFPAGTVLLSGSAIPTDLSFTQIELYASRDRGHTWHFVSHVAAGGEARPINGLTPVWEPYMFVYANQLIIYYSDQRDPDHGQKLVHQVSRDLVNWGPVVDDVAYPTYTDRPGMPIVTKLPNGKYFYVYEYGGAPELSPRYTFPLHYRISANPLQFSSAPDFALVTVEGTRPISSPFVVWSPVGGVNGTIIVSSGTHENIYINRALGEGLWQTVATKESRSYTRHLRVMPDVNHLLIIGGGHLPPSTTNAVRVGVMEIPV